MKQDNKDSFMKNITLNLKHFALLFILAMFSVTASAVNVTYSLTTHTGTQRTIEGIANLTADADLLNNMPQALWRAYCTYKFYSDVELTQEISTVPADGGTVYVDYVFDPPFILSEEGKDPVWHYLRTWNEGGQNNYLLFLKQRVYPEYEGVFGHKHTSAMPLPSYGRNGIDPNAAMGKLGDCQWAFYGDAYDLNIKINDDVYGENGWLQWSSTTSSGNLKLGAKPTIGWQIYVNQTQKQDRSYNWYSYPTMMLGVPDTDYYVELSNVSYAIKTSRINISSSQFDYKFDNRHQLVPKNSNPTSTIKKNQWWYGLFATPVGTGLNLNYHVTYKILQANGEWYNKDIIKSQLDQYGNGAKLSFPSSDYPMKEGYEYDYFYKDAGFSDKYADDYTMANTANIVAYIKETKDSYVATPWRTLVLPYDIANLDAHFGENGVRVLEYSSVEGELNGDAFRCNLVFTPVDEIEAYKPYLFKADHVKQSVLDGMCHTVTGMQEPIEIKKYDNTNAPQIGVCMKGVLADGGYPMPGDGLNFFFGSMPNAEVEDYDNYTYKFYRVEATIPQFVCYFYVTDERTPSGAPIRVSFGTESLTGVSSVVADVKVNNSIYSLDGRKVNASSLDNLKRGIYIINGRKVVK